MNKLPCIVPFLTGSYVLCRLCLCRKSTTSQGWARSAAKTRWPETWTGCSSSSPETTTSSPEPGASLESRFLSALVIFFFYFILFFSPHPSVFHLPIPLSWSAASATSRRTSGPRRTRRTSVNPTLAARAKASSSPGPPKTSKLENTWSARCTYRGWGAAQGLLQGRVNISYIHMGSFLHPAFHHWRIQVWLAHLRPGDIMRPVQDIHVQRGTCSLLHHQVHRPDQQQRGKRQTNEVLSFLFGTFFSTQISPFSGNMHCSSKCGFICNRNK